MGHNDVYAVGVADGMSSVFERIIFMLINHYYWYLVLFKFN